MGKAAMEVGIYEPKSLDPIRRHIKQEYLSRINGKESLSSNIKPLFALPATRS